MTLPKIVEMTLYNPLISYLQDLGFKAVGETQVAGKRPDILFEFDGASFVIEVKMGKPEIGLKATAQAYEYAKRLKTQNIIVLTYPEKFKGQGVYDDSIVHRIALEEKVEALLLTDYWTESLSIAPAQLFKSLKERIIAKETKIDFNTLVKLIESYVKDLNSVIYQIKSDQLISEVVDKLDLFSAISEIKDKEKAKRQITNLASYLLFNQLLFYHIFKRKTRNRFLPELERIGKIQDLQDYFDKITSINYKSIYKVNILGHIPNEQPVIEILNDLIDEIKYLREEHITHDLAGRFFHDLIPDEVRKVLAAFYTHPIAAEILAGLAIDSWDETIIDPACGSGTLLVSSYKRKQKIYKNLYGYKDIKGMHKKFLEEDLTGIDIMPFAAHLTTINLATQNIEEETNVVRVVTKDSLELARKLRNEEFKDKGIKLSPYTVSMQKTLFGASKQEEAGGTVSPEGKGEEFHLKPADIVIMNPLFSDREKMPKDMREKLNENKILGDICGHLVNLWGYFLALADYLVKPGGKIAAVIPINIFRGKATEKIRKHLIKNYKIKYVIKAGENVAFSEKAQFRDILLVAEKEKPSEDDKTRFVTLNEDIHNLTPKDASDIAEYIRGESSETGKRIDIIDYDYRLLKENIDNLMPLFGPTSAKSAETLSSFLSIVHKHIGDSLRKLKKSEIEEGFHASPAGLSQLAFISNPIKKGRLAHAFLVLKRKSGNFLEFYIKDLPGKTFRVEKSKLAPALRTLTNVKKFDITDVDYVITDKFKGWKTVLQHSKYEDKENFTYDIIRNKIKWTHLVVARRFRPNSKNTHFFAFYSDKKFVAPDTLKYILLDRDAAKINTLFLNSVLGIINLILLKEQTTGGYTDVREGDLIFFDILDVNALNEEQKDKLFELYDELKQCEFPSIVEQFKERSKPRVKLDRKLLQILGIPNEEINKWLPRIYDTIVNELSHD